MKLKLLQYSRLKLFKDDWKNVSFLYSPRCQHLHTEDNYTCILNYVTQGRYLGQTKLLYFFLQICISTKMSPYFTDFVKTGK
jgi:hypothetical protein